METVKNTRKPSGIFINCEICGKTIEIKSYNQRTCGGECSKELRRMEQRKPRKKKIQVKTVKGKTLGELAAEAREAGMTYGQYIAITEKGERVE